MEIFFYKEKIKKLFQWDQRVPMIIDGMEDTESVEAVFSAVGTNRGERRTLESKEEGWSCTVPDIVLQYGTMISVFITATADGRQTKYTEKFEVVRQARPDGYVDNDDSEYIKTDELIGLAKAEADRAGKARTGAETAVVKAFDDLREIVSKAEAEKNAAEKMVEDGAIAVNQIVKKAKDAEENAKKYSETAKSFSDQSAASAKSASQSANSASLASKSSADYSEYARRYSNAANTYAENAAKSSANAKEYYEKTKDLAANKWYWCNESEVSDDGLPKIDNPDYNTLYFVPNHSTSQNNKFDEFAWKGYWEKIGSNVGIELSQYALKENVDSRLTEIESRLKKTEDYINSVK